MISNFTLHAVSLDCLSSLRNLIFAYLIVNLLFVRVNLLFVRVKPTVCAGVSLVCL